MKKDSDIYLIQFDKLNSLLKKLSEYELENIRKGNKEIVIKIQDVSYKNSTIHPSLSEKDQKELIFKLNHAMDRDRGYELLSSFCKKKGDLQLIAKRLDLPFTIKDSIKKLESKIIENTIGFRLRSQAIQK